MSKDIKEQFGIDEHRPSDWFEKLYAEANSDGAGVPWAEMDTHPSFKRWLKQQPLSANNVERALVVGCGMGDDAIELEARGFDVTAFDISQTAIDYCKQRFAQSSVQFLQADLLKAQAQWREQFDFVLEIYTIQALPPKYEQQLISSIASFVKPGGQLLVIAEVCDEARHFDKGPPWLLTPGHVQAFEKNGLSLSSQQIENDDSSAPAFGKLGRFVSTFIKKSCSHNSAPGLDSKNTKQ
ncbi:class I SAM-dependent methyltransferase [Agaribacterium haliotis]|uniref:class I SAM-dependent methyltransferase n=1 Tax=Agaribacterium haliotis TaxID=2013869 RepID=UPI000BB58D8C|nr:class I SAM-dependent methyltransferase [Agaribacterium haliotis]